MAVCGIYRMHPIVLRQAFKFSKIAQCERKKSIPKTKDRWRGTICLEVKAYIYAYILYIDIFYHSLSLFLVPGPSHKARQLAWKYGRGETWLHGFKSPECLFLCIEFSCLHINPIYIYT